MTKQEKINEIERLIHIMWRNMPCYPCTFSICPNDGCNRPARGSRMCFECAVDKLGDLCGSNAARYATALKQCIHLKSEMIDGDDA